jgi:signal peptidase I
MFCAGSYRISTASMNDALQKGDFVLVNKITGKMNPGRNRIVLFKSPLQKDAPEPPTFLSRCVGMPGDTVQITEDGYCINGRLLKDAPAPENLFRIRKDIKEPLLETLHDLQIPYRDIAEDSLCLTIRLTLKEERLIRENLPQIVKIERVREDTGNYTFAIPTTGKPYKMDSANLIIYREAILREVGEKGLIRDGKLLIDGKEIPAYSFRQDYYWMLSDNADDAIDSRHLGLIPSRSIIGNVWFCWYSKDKARLFKQMN